jgi:hypothetical protein
MGIFEHEAIRELPANRDRGQDLPLRDNPFTDEGPSNEGLIGLYPYSGADIKLVIHLPPEDPRAGDDRLAEVEADLQRYTNNLEWAMSAEEVGQVESQLQIYRELEALHLQEVELSESGSQARTDAEARVAADRVKIEELNDLVQTQLRSTVNRETLAEITQSIDSLTRQLEALRAEGAAGPTTRTKVLGEISTLSLSNHREKYPVRTLGSVYPKSFTRGGRVIAGSAVFTVFHQHVLYEFLEVSQYRSTGVGDFDRFRWTSHLMDQLPPLDISISFANEYGNLSWMSILGVEFVNEGMVMSIEDLFIEGTAQYVARDFDPLRNVANRRLSRSNGVGQALTGSSIMINELMRRQNRRNVPWI